MGFQFQILLADKNLSSAAFRETALRRCVELLQKNHTGIDCRDKPPPTGNFLPALLTEAHFQQIAELPDLHGSPAFPHQPPAAVTGIEVRIETERPYSGLLAWVTVQSSTGNGEGAKRSARAVTVNSGLDRSSTIVRVTMQCSASLRPLFSTTEYGVCSATCHGCPSITGSGASLPNAL